MYIIIIITLILHANLLMVPKWDHVPSMCQIVPTQSNTCICITLSTACSHALYKTLQMIEFCRTSRPRVKKFWPRPFYIQASNTSHGFLPHTNSWFIRVPSCPLRFCELLCKWLNSEGRSVWSMILMMMITMMIKTNNENAWKSCLRFCIARCPQYWNWILKNRQEPHISPDFH